MIKEYGNIFYRLATSVGQKKIKFSPRMAVFMLETLKLSKTLKSSRDDFNVSSIKTAIIEPLTFRVRAQTLHYYKYNISY